MVSYQDDFFHLISFGETMTKENIKKLKIKLLYLLKNHKSYVI